MRGGSGPPTRRGLCVWIVEKLRAWTDDRGRSEGALTRDQTLDDVMLYWLPGTGVASSESSRLTDSTPRSGP